MPTARPQRQAPQTRPASSTGTPWRPTSPPAATSPCSGSSPPCTRLTRKLDQWYDRQLADLDLSHGEWAVLAQLATVRRARPDAEPAGRRHQRRRVLDDPPAGQDDRARPRAPLPDPDNRTRVLVELTDAGLGAVRGRGARGQRRRVRRPRGPDTRGARPAGRAPRGGDQRPRRPSRPPYRAALRGVSRGRCGSEVRGTRWRSRGRRTPGSPSRARCSPGPSCPSRGRGRRGSCPAARPSGRWRRPARGSPRCSGGPR